jgi:hypothetical protein
MDRGRGLDISKRSLAYGSGKSEAELGTATLAELFGEEM